MEYKQAILIRTDLGMSKGKMCAQAAHASIEATLRVIKLDKLLKTDIFKNWKDQGMKKVVLKINSKEDLFKYKDLAERNSIKVSAIKDAGMTEIPAGTYTALAIGPDDSKKIDKITGNLQSL
ncbi:MAG: peptidyl-tRNA hydrolase [Candidatus Woesearchaeota archaeon]|nr:MAG: peptidyl-tRNA hydrolase [Candidatus Woesearchaeota archaeon]